MVCLNLMSMCCEGKSDLAEIKCQTDIITVHTALTLYRAAEKMWPFKCSLLKYISHCYLDSGNVLLFSEEHNGKNIKSLKEIIELVRSDMVSIHEEWHDHTKDSKLIFPDGTVSSFGKESKVCALEYVTYFFKSFLRNKKIELGVDMFPTLHEITAKVAKMYYDTSDENFKMNAMDLLQFINNSEKYARLLENVQHPAN